MLVIAALFASGTATAAAVAAGAPAPAPLAFANTSPSAASCTNGTLFTAYTTPPSKNGGQTCQGPSTTTCFPYGRCAVLPQPAYSWSSVGGNNGQGYLYSGAHCTGDYATEHFDANGVCFDPSALGLPAGSSVGSFCVAPSNAKCAAV